MLMRPNDRSKQNPKCFQLVQKQTQKRQISLTTNRFYEASPVLKMGTWHFWECWHWETLKLRDGFLHGLFAGDPKGNCLLYQQIIVSVVPFRRRFFHATLHIIIKPQNFQNFPAEPEEMLKQNVSRLVLRKCCRTFLVHHKIDQTKFFNGQLNFGYLSNYQSATDHTGEKPATWLWKTSWS